MKRLAAVVVAALFAVGLMATPASASHCGGKASPQTSGTVNEQVDGTYLYADASASRSWAGIRGGDGFLEVYGDEGSSSLFVHGKYNPEAGTANGKVGVENGAPVVCLGGQKIV